VWNVASESGSELGTEGEHDQWEEPVEKGKRREEGEEAGEDVGGEVYFVEAAEEV